MTLNAFKDNGPCTIKVVMELLGVSPGAMTGKVDTLEKKGLLARSLNPKDRRTTLVGVTQEGEKLIKEVVKEVGA